MSYLSRYIALYNKQGCALLGQFSKTGLVLMDLHGFMICGAVLQFFLIVLSGEGSCRPEGQGKGQVVQGSMEVGKKYKTETGYRVYFSLEWQTELT